MEFVALIFVENELSCYTKSVFLTHKLILTKTLFQRSQLKTYNIN